MDFLPPCKPHWDWFCKTWTCHGPQLPVTHPEMHPRRHAKPSFDAKDMWDNSGLGHGWGMKTASPFCVHDTLYARTAQKARTVAVWPGHKHKVSNISPLCRTFTQRITKWFANAYLLILTTVLGRNKRHRGITSFAMERGQFLAWNKYLTDENSAAQHNTSVRNEMNWNRGEGEELQAGTVWLITLKLG